MSADLEIKNLHVAYGEKVVFDGFNATFSGDKISVIFGSSGVGKTTLLNAVAGIVPYQGEVLGVEGDVSYVFQKDRLMPHVSMFKNLDLVLRSKIADKIERKEKIVSMLEKLEIASEINKLPRELSGGQLQRVTLARAFLYPSRVLLMDEPFRALDHALKDRLFEYFFALLEEFPRTVLFVTHDVEECLLSADSYYVLKGEPASIVFQGAVDITRSERKLGGEDAGEARRELYSAIVK